MRSATLFKTAAVLGLSFVKGEDTRPRAGLPVRRKLIARPLAEETLFSLSWAFEDHVPESDRPPL